MSTIDFSPLFRSTVGFDRLAGLLENSRRLAVPDGWPPYDIARVGENDYRITVDVAGFTADRLTVTHEANALSISGAARAEPAGQYLHRGIADQGFQRRFDLADHVDVVGARLEHGLLTIELHRALPEALKPRRIDIDRRSPLPGAETRQIEADRRAA